MPAVVTIAATRPGRVNSAMLTIHYFASVREALNRDRDELALPAGVRTVRDLVSHLSAQDGQFARLSQSDNPLLVAVNQTVASPSQPLNGDEEVAFFPPMTGG